MSEIVASEGVDTIANMKRVLDLQKKAFIKNGPPSLEERKARLNVCINLLVDNADAIAEALNADFGGRPMKFNSWLS